MGTRRKGEASTRGLEERSSRRRAFVTVEHAPALRSALPFAGWRTNESLGERDEAREGSVLFVTRDRDTGRARGFEEGTRDSGHAPSLERSRPAWIFSVARRRARGLLLGVGPRGSLSSRIGRPRRGVRIVRRPAKSAFCAIARSQDRRTKLAGRSTQRGSIPPAPCSRVVRVAEVDRPDLARRSAPSAPRGAKPLARASDASEREPSERERIDARASRARGLAKGHGESERGDPHHVSATRSTSRDVGAASRGAAVERCVAARRRSDVTPIDGRHLTVVEGAHTSR